MTSESTVIKVTDDEQCIELDPKGIEYFASVFKRFDVNKDGQIQREEIIQQEGVSATVADSMLKLSDQDRNGMADFNEFIDMLCRHQKIFQKYVRRYIKLFIIPKPKKGTCRIFFRKKRSFTGRYERLIQCNASTLLVAILGICQLALFLYLKNDDDWLRFSHESRRQLWRYFTFIFTHIDEEHVVQNVSTQLLVGIPLTMVHGWRVLVIYLAGTLGGCLFQSIGGKAQDTLRGASPAVYAVLTSHISNIILNFSEVTQAIPQLIIFGFFTIFDTLYNYYVYGNGGRVSYISHLGGAITGFLVGMFILKNIRSKPYESVLRGGSLVLYIVMMGTMIGLEIWNWYKMEYMH